MSWDPVEFRGRLAERLDRFDWQGAAALCDELIAHSYVTFSTDGMYIHTPQGALIWHSGLSGIPASFLIVQNDGNVVIYKSDGVPVWATNTVQ